MPAFSNKWTVFLLAILAGVLIWNQNREPDHAPTQETQRPLPKVVESPPPSPVETPSPSFQAESPPPTPAETPPPATAEIPVPPIPPATALPSPAIPPSSAAAVIPGSATDIPADAEDITEELSAVDSAIRNFQTVHGENPIGSNREITAALLGNNLKQLKLEVPTGSHVNGEGQMCDRWGTPYFFHQVSATEMEIRSAGPDRLMWTGDDSQM